MAAILHTTLWDAFYLNENVRILIKISLNFVPKGQINNIPAMVHLVAWWSGDMDLGTYALRWMLQNLTDDK